MSTLPSITPLASVYWVDMSAYCTYTIFDRNNKLVNGQKVVAIGAQAKDATGGRAKIIKRVSASVFDVVLDVAFSAGTTNNWSWVTLAAPYEVPGSGDYYIGFYFTGLYGPGNAGFTDRGYASGDKGVGTGYATLAEDDGGPWIPCAVEYQQTLGAAPTFSGITGLSDNGDGTLTASWGSASDHSFFRIHLHTSSMASGETTYLVAEAKSTATSCRIGNIAGSTAKLTAGTTYYVMVEAVSAGGTVDGNSVNLTAVPTNPNASGAIAVVIPAPTPVALAGTETTIYTCPAGKSASVKCVHLANIDSSARTVTIYKVKSGDSAADDTTLAKTRSLGAAGDATAEDYLGPFTLAAGDKISGLCSSANKVTATAEVVEVTL